ncbi:hypothetical protein [Tepidimonas taiwanensis]|nr:hypothetical protein [Tepidimonas taiwanensis]
MADPYINARHYVCGLCKPPARAGKGRTPGAIGTALSTQIA